MTKLIKTMVGAAFLLGAPLVASAQITVTAPATTVAVASADDWATKTYQDPWDMNQRTDIAYFLNGTDQPLPGLTNTTFSNSIFSALSTNNDPSFFLLESTNQNVVPGTQKTGGKYSIDASKYKILAFRMSVTTASAIQLLWNPDSLYNSAVSTGSAIATTPGWRIYTQLIPALTLTPSGGQPWSGTVRTFRFDPSVLPNETIQFDWIRLVDDNAALYRTITWTGSTSVDIYLDNDTNPATGNLGPIALNVTGTSYSFYAGALPGGTYYVAVVQQGSAATTAAYSPGAYAVNEIPTLTFTSPSEEGSSDDFATTQLGNPWDMDALTDVDRTVNVDGATIRSDLTFEDEAGNSLGTQRVYYGTSTATTGNGDPEVYGMWSTQRGFNARIDPDRYRIFTIEYGIPNKPRNYNDGSAARVIWKVAGESVENVSQEFFVNHRAGVNVLAKLSIDMKAVTLAVGGSPSTTGWNKGTSSKPGLDNFRFDPHEFSAATPFYIKRMKLAALEKANGSYTIRWTYSKSTGTVQFFRTTNTSGAGQTAISDSISATTGSYTWNSSSTPNGTYYILAVFSDGVNSNQVYSPWPVVIDGASADLPRIVLSRDQLNFGVTNSNTSTQLGTSTQTVRVTVVGSGTPCWTLSTDQPSFITLGPGACGSGTFTVSVNARGVGTPYPVGDVRGSIFVTSSGASNSPQSFQFLVRTFAVGGTGVPTGSVDTPANGAGVSGSIAVTGWARDDIEITSVQVYRDAIGGEAPGEKYLGDAVLVDDARPDLQAANPDLPRNYRLGWGYLLLTNMLPLQGNANYNLKVYANDREGNKVLLGARIIAGQNATATAPFGALDTPGQGEVISGTAYVNFGWALTPQPKNIPTDGSTIKVVIDGTVVGRVTYNQYRADIAGLFPGYANTNGAIGFFVIDTTKYANGLHTIEWVVTDSAGVSAGIGSRYFTIAN